MKISLFVILIFFVAIGAGNAANYEEVMVSNIEKIYILKSQEELKNLGNTFIRIGNAEKDKWLPGYYAGYCYVRSIFFGEMTSKDKHLTLDMAQQELDKILKIAIKESEVYTLQALIYQMRITDASKGYKYSKLSNEALAVAEKFNAKNPRIYYLKGSSTFHTPKMFGGGKDKAKPMLEKAASLFETNKPSGKLHPSWGSFHNNQLLEQCQ